MKENNIMHDKQSNTLKKVLVLMSSYNGDKYIDDQIKSILAQQGVEVEVLVRDDGSVDDTCAILTKYSQEGHLSWYKGENLGCAKSFWTLLKHCDKADYYAFCDQDDVWDRDKLKTAVDAMEKENISTPLLYFCDVRVTDSRLNVISENMVKHSKLDYPHSLIKNIAPGCTYVFNNEALSLLREFKTEYLEYDIHDWAAYKIISCFGKCIFDKTPHMSYRQHAGNVIGANTGLYLEIKSAIKRFLNPAFNNKREKRAQNLLAVFGDRMSPKNKEITELFANYRKNTKTKIQFLTCKELKFSGLRYRYFQLLIILNKI